MHFVLAVVLQAVVAAFAATLVAPAGLASSMHLMPRQRVVDHPVHLIPPCRLLDHGAAVVANGQLTEVAASAQGLAQGLARRPAWGLARGGWDRQWRADSLDESAPGQPTGAP